MKLDQESSERLNILRFPLIVGVVFIHVYGSDVGFSEGIIGVSQLDWYTSFFQNLISQGIARISVPLFFLMAGYLFFFGFEWSLNNYKKKLLSRVKTLLIPFLFWNLLTLFLIAVAQNLPTTQSFFPDKNSLIAPFTLYDYLKAFFGINRFPIAYQFWFIRDLIVMILLVPLLNAILKFFPMLALSIFSFLWLIPLWPINIPSSQAFYFFYIGGYFAVSKQSLFKYDKSGNYFLLFYAGLLLSDVLTKGLNYHGLIHRTGLLFGVISVLYVTKFVISRNLLKSFLLWSASASFFIFAVHEPLLTVCKKLAYKLLMPTTDVLILGLYLFTPVFVICMSLIAYILTKRFTPWILNIVTGGR